MKLNDLGTDPRAQASRMGGLVCSTKKNVFNETTGARVTLESIKSDDSIDKVHQFAETTASSMKVIQRI